MGVGAGQGPGAEGARGLRAMSGKIAHLSNQQTSDFRKQFRGKQPVSVRPSWGRTRHPCPRCRWWWWCPVQSHPPYVVAAAVPRFVPFVLFVHVNCFCPLKIQQRNQKKKRTKINETNPERGNPVPCHAFLMKCRRLRNILWHDLIVVLLCLRTTGQRVKRGRQVVSNV